MGGGDGEAMCPDQNIRMAPDCDPWAVWRPSTSKWTDCVWQNHLSSPVREGATGKSETPAGKRAVARVTTCHWEKGDSSLQKVREGGLVIMATSPQMGQGKGRGKPGGSQVPHPHPRREPPVLL